MNITDTYKTKGLRKKLVEDLIAKGITDAGVLAAIGRIPRHLFIESSFFDIAAYEDKAFQIGCGQTISQPYTVAVQSQLLEIQANDKVLEVGTGSGYQCAVLLELGAKVFSIERQRELYQNSKKLLSSLNYSYRSFYGDGYQGLPNFSPFDKIIITCGAPFVPEALVQQLKIGGLMVIPVGENQQVMKTIRRLSPTEVEEREHGSFRFVPMLEERSK